MVPLINMDGVGGFVGVFVCWHSVYACVFVFAWCVCVFVECVCVYRAIICLCVLSQSLRNQQIQGQAIIWDSPLQGY